MKTRELIAALQREDPTGEAEVVADGTPIYCVEGQFAGYDGPLQMLLEDEEKKGKSWSITGYKVTVQGMKVRLHLMGLRDVLLDYPDMPVDLSELSGWNRERWEHVVTTTRAEMQELNSDT